MKSLVSQPSPWMYFYVIYFTVSSYKLSVLNDKITRNCTISNNLNVAELAGFHRSQFIIIPQKGSRIIDSRLACRLLKTHTQVGDPAVIEMQIPDMLD